jgi:hypothetical protein
MWVTLSKKDAERCQGISIGSDSSRAVIRGRDNILKGIAETPETEVQGM